jgi:hypothetical protein
MEKETNHSELLNRIVGGGGDYYIGNQAAVADKKFAHIEIGKDGATLVGVQIGNQDIMAERNYPAAMPGGYLICAGGKEYVNYINLSAGYAKGYPIAEE